MVQAASTMNQSDIRGLVCHQQARADIDILRQIHHAIFLLFLASYSLKTDHINPANSSPE